MRRDSEAPRLVASLWRVALTSLLAACTATPPPPLHPPAPAGSTPEPSPSIDHSWRSQRPESGTASRVEFPPTMAVTLENGLQLFLVTRPSPVVSLSLIARVGSTGLPESKVGASALTARLMTEEAQALQGTALVEAVESLGTSLDEQAGRDSTSLGLVVLRQDVERGLGLLAEVVQRPLFRAETLERVRQEWLDNLRSERQSPQRLASLAGMRAVFDGALGLPTSGTPARVRELGIRDLQRFHRQAFVPGSCAVIIVGNVDLATAHASVKRHFDSWSGGAPVNPWAAPANTAPANTAPANTAPTNAATTPTAAPQIQFIDRPGAVQTAIFVGQAFPGRSAGGTEAREVMNNALGGLFSARLNQNLRERHAYTYGAFSSTMAARNWGLFLASTSVKTEVTAPALKELLGELERVKLPEGQLTQPEIERAKSDLIRNLGASLEEVTRTASIIDGHFIYGLALDYFERLPTTWAAIDLAGAQAETQRLDRSKFSIVLVGDRATTEPALRQAGYTLTDFPLTSLD